MGGGCGPPSPTSARAMKEPQLSDPHLESTLPPSPELGCEAAPDQLLRLWTCGGSVYWVCIQIPYISSSCGLPSAVVTRLWRLAMTGSIWNQFDSSKQKRKRRGRRGRSAAALCFPCARRAGTASRHGPTPTNLITVWRTQD